MFKYILFDLDGTLTNPKEGITKSVQYALAHFNIDEPNLDALEMFIGPPLEASFKTYYKFTEEQAKLAVEKYRERYRQQGIFENKVYPGIHQMLQDLQAADKKIALATSKPECFARQILEKYELLPYFDEVVGSELDGRRSNKAEVIEEALKRLKVTKRNQVIMVGDRKYDVLGAKACQIVSAGVTFGYAQDGELEEVVPEYIVTTIEELTKLLNKSGF